MSPTAASNVAGGADVAVLCNIAPEASSEMPGALPMVPPPLTDLTRAYKKIFASREAMWPFAAATVARLPVSMAPLGIVVLTAGERDSYGIAGVLAGTFTLGAAAGSPAWGRWMDRVGPSKALRYGSCGGAFLLGVLAAATVHGAPGPALVAIAAVAGLAFVPISPAMRATWVVIFPHDDELRRRCYALDAVALDLVFVVGPLLLSVSLLRAPVLPLILTIVLLAGGGIVFSLTSAVRSSRPESVDAIRAEWTKRPRLRDNAQLWAVLVVSAGLSVGFGVVDTSLVAMATSMAANPSDLGLLFAAIAGGSIVGGLSYGARPMPCDEELWLARPLGFYAIALGSASLWLATHGFQLLVLMPILFVVGLMISPCLIILQNIVEAYAPRDRHNEAQSWLSASNVSGAALGTALAGFLIDGFDVSFALGTASLAVVGGAAVASLRWPDMGTSAALRALTVNSAAGRQLAMQCGAGDSVARRSGSMYSIVKSRRVGRVHQVEIEA